MYGIIGAVQYEIDEVVSQLTNLSEKNINGVKFYLGTYKACEFVIAYAGAGKVNASITTTLMISSFKINYILNIGIAGGLNGATHFDVVVGDKIVYHDFDNTISKKGYVFGQVPGLDPYFKTNESIVGKLCNFYSNNGIQFKKGTIASGDQWISKLGALNNIRNIYDDIYAVDMESAAIAHTATIFNIPFAIVRSISDIVEEENQIDIVHKLNREAAIRVSKSILEALTTD